MKIIGIHLLVEDGDRVVLECERRLGDGMAGNAIAVAELELVTCPWCLGAKSKEHARRIVARQYAKVRDDEDTVHGPRGAE